MSIRWLVTLLLLPLAVGAALLAVMRHEVVETGTGEVVALDPVASEGTGGEGGERQRMRVRLAGSGEELSITVASPASLLFNVGQTVGVRYQRHPLFASQFWVRDVLPPPRLEPEGSREGPVVTGP